jgi:hypothetical protein
LTAAGVLKFVHKQVVDVFSDGQSAVASRRIKWKSWLNA